MVTTIGSNVTPEWCYATCVMPLVLCHLLHYSVFALAFFFIGNFQGQSNILVLKFTSNELVEEMW